MSIVIATIWLLLFLLFIEIIMTLFGESEYDPIVPEPNNLLRAEEE